VKVKLNPRRVARRPGLLALAILALAACAVPAFANSSRRSAIAASSTYTTSLNYAIRFYPRFLTFFQQNYARENKFTGPDSMGPRYGLVVAPNNDTVYGEAFVNLSQGPDILTIPKTNVSYSLLTLDVWGDVFDTGISGAGTYGLVQRNWHGTLPSGVKRIVVPYVQSEWIIRADRYASNGRNTNKQATFFRNHIRLATLSDYKSNPSTGSTLVLPLAFFSPRMKAMTDQAITESPRTFFGELQKALHSSTTRPLTASDIRLSHAFDRVFAVAKAAAAHGNYRPMSEITQAAVDAHTMIIDNWVTHIGKTRWVYFNNVGAWGTKYLDRASLTEYIQYGNNVSAATYYDAFTDSGGVPLDGGVIPAYRITFTKSQLPQAKRFWSVTAYIPPGVTLFPNSGNKWVVGSYTPGLRTARDGSVTIYIQTTPPAKPLRANWLPIPKGSFSLLLRVYGPTGNTATGNYTPPAVKPYRVIGRL
jgi:hypothetical protein